MEYSDCGGVVGFNGRLIFFRYRFGFIIHQSIVAVEILFRVSMRER